MTLPGNESGTQSAELDEYLAILRCQTWNVWPERVVIECPLRIKYGPKEAVPSRLAIASYLNRTEPTKYRKEPTTVGPLVWDGRVPGWYLVRDTVLKAPEDVTQAMLVHRQTHRGEIDISINFKFEGDLPTVVVEAIHATALAIMSLINLRLKDYLTPSLPIQIGKVLNAGRQIASNVRIGVRARHNVSRDIIAHTISEIVETLGAPTGGEKLRVALELYAAHFTEHQARVRCLLLVMAMEALATSTKKHPIAVSFLKTWQLELKTELEKHDRSSEESQSLQALLRELNFREEDSIRSQVRKLFRNSAAEMESASLERRALAVYDKRSTLVHDGALPTDELERVEREARELLELLFTSFMKDSRKSREATDEMPP